MYMDEINTWPRFICITKEKFIAEIPYMAENDINWKIREGTSLNNFSDTLLNFNYKYDFNHNIHKF